MKTACRPPEPGLLRVKFFYDLFQNPTIKILKASVFDFKKEAILLFPNVDLNKASWLVVHPVFCWFGIPTGRPLRRTVGVPNQQRKIKKIDAGPPRPGRVGGAAQANAHFFIISRKKQQN